MLQNYSFFGYFTTLNDISLALILLCSAICINFVKFLMSNKMFFLKNILLLIISPQEGWKGIGKYTIPNNLLLSKLYYPCLALLSLSLFVPYIAGYESSLLQNVIMSAMVDFVKFFISFFAISYLLTGIYADLFKSKNQVNNLNNFIIYNLTILVVFNILRNLMPGFPFFDIFPLYIIYVVYRGCDYLSIPEEQIKKFVAITSILLILIPIGIKFVLDLMIPNI